MRLEVCTVVYIYIVLWHVTPCLLVWLYRHFIESNCFHNHKWWTFHPENEGSRILGNGGTYLTDSTASHSRRQYCILHNSYSSRPKISAFSLIFLINHALLIYACWMRILFKRSKISAHYNVTSCCLVTIYHNFGGIFDTDSTLQMDATILQILVNSYQIARCLIPGDSNQISHFHIWTNILPHKCRGADKSLARQGRKKVASVKSETGRGMD